MNKKYLFGMLLSGAMLAACTADDALDTAKVAQGTNPSAPVFTVGLDNGPQNRAEYTAAGNKVTFQADDKLSLYHGMTDANAQGEDGAEKWQNAIYLAKAGAGDTKLDFSTTSMVQEGLAIMVWPADETVDNMNAEHLGNPLKVRVKQTQGPEDRANVPYISEAIEIQKDGKAGGTGDKGTAGVAGYDNKYDILLRRAAGTLQILLNTINQPPLTGVDPFEIKAVEINMEGPDKENAPFSLALPVVVSTTKFTDQHEDYPSWRYGTSLKRDEAISEDDDKAGWIKTKDIEDGIATFTLLPGVKDESADFSSCDGYVVVYTNWGKVKISHDNKAYGKNYNEDLNTRMADLVTKLWYDEGVEGSEFEGEETGGFAGTYAKVDLDSLDVNGMHIADEKELKTVLAVYEQLKDKMGDDITLILDGTKGEFVISDATTRAKVVNYMNTGALKFQACTTDGEACTSVKLVNGATAAEEVPNLTFDTTDGVQATAPGNIAVKLAGAWKFNSKNDKEANKKKLAGVSELDILDGATLELQSNVYPANGTTAKIVVNRGGSVNVPTDVQLNMNLENKGTITIGDRKTFSLGDNIYLVNWWSEKLSTDASSYKLTAKNQSIGADNRCGVILNQGTLGAANNTTAKINNYGVIKLENAFAAAMISNNATTGAAITTALTAPTSITNGEVTGGNVFGVILLNDSIGGQVATSTGLTKVANTNTKGFIKLELGANDDVINEKVGKVANYVVTKGQSICATKGKVLGHTDETSATTAEFDYLEVQSQDFAFGSAVNTTTTFKLKGLIIPNSNTICDVPAGKTVNVSVGVCLKGQIRGNGIATGASYATTYFGGAATESVRNTTAAAQ